jgi:uncharacterized repeat protein (TIGR04076 family)
MKQLYKTSLTIQQRPFCGPKNCPWHRRYKEGKAFAFDEIFPHDVCPWLYNAIYPYFLGLYYGARFSYNEDGDCNVCCPAANGVDVIVRLRPNDGSFDSRISSSMKFVIFAEIVKVLGDCPFGHKVGQRVPFPTCMVEHFLCPAAFHNVFPFMCLEPPSCIDLNNLRCPDWNDVIFFALPFVDNE